jgi:hypothetical protein
MAMPIDLPTPGLNITEAKPGAMSREWQQWLQKLLLEAHQAFIPPKGVIPCNLTAADIAAYFDATGRGIRGTPYEWWAICNGNNGTPDLNTGTPLIGHDNSAAATALSGSDTTGTGTAASTDSYLTNWAATICTVGNTFNPGVGNRALTATSFNGTVFIDRTANNVRAQELFGICWAPGLDLFVGVGDPLAGPVGPGATSPDGITWTQNSGAVKNVRLSAVGWSEGLSQLVAVGSNDGADAYILSSFDGSTWSEQANPTNNILRGIVWCPSLSLWIAVGYNQVVTNDYIITSPDSSTWTSQASPHFSGLWDVAWSEETGVAVAVGAYDVNSKGVVTSTDGATWVAKDTPKAFTLTGVDYSPALNMFCAVGVADGTDAYLIISTDDGETWTEQTNPKNVALNSIVWSVRYQLWIAVGASDGGDSYVITSPDGETWTERATTYTQDLYDIACRPASTVSVALAHTHEIDPAYWEFVWLMRL